MLHQKTIRSRVVVQGTGLHSGAPCSLAFIPAPPNVGVHFVRADLPGRPSLAVDAKNVVATGYATTLGNEHFQVATVEHCLSALSALRLDNLFIELEGPEIPIVDGSSAPYLEAIQSVGLIEQDALRQYCYITRAIHIGDGDKQATVTPYHGLRLTVNIEFSHPSIGSQRMDLDINEVSFTREIASARTFGFVQELEILHKQGLAQGAGLHNAIGLTPTGILNPEGLRWKDEFVRHKTLDALGDLVTLGMPLMGHLILHKAGHDLMNKLVRKIQDSPDCYRRVQLGEEVASLS